MNYVASNDILGCNGKAKEHFNYFLSFLLFFYVIIYPPLIFSDYHIESSFRIGFEIAILSFLIFTQILYKKIKIVLLLYLFLIFAKLPFVSLGVETVISRANKLIILLLLFKYIKNNAELGTYLKKIYIGISWFIILQLSFGFIAAIVMPTAFKYQLLTEGAIYPYYGNFLFGNYLNKYFGAVRVPRMCGYFTEPGLLASFLGINIFYYKSAVKTKLFRRTFLLLTIFAIFTTFSFTGYIAIITTLITINVFKYLKSNRSIRNKILLIILLLIVSFLLLKNMDKFLKYSSIDDRTMRYFAGISLVLNMNPKTLLFGYGIGFLGDFDRGFASGVLNLIIEQGLLYFGIVIFIMKKAVNKSSSLFIYSLIINIAFDFFSWPLFWLSLFVINIVDENNYSS